METPILNFPEYASWGWLIPFGLVLMIVSHYFFKIKFSKTWLESRLLSLSQRSISKTWLKYGLFLTGMGMIFIALLGPKWGYQETIENQKDVDIVILVDVSKSMSVEDVKPTRLDRAKIKMNDLIDLARVSGEYRIALTVFAGSAFIYSPLTRDYTSLHVFTQNISQEMVSEHGTDLTLGLKVALSAFPEDQGKEQKVIVIFTDGESHEREVIQMAEKARSEGVIIYTMGVGTPNGELVPIKDEQGNIVDYLKDEQGNIILSKLDQTTLNEIANLTGGSYSSSSLGKEDLQLIIDDLDQLSQGNNRERIVKSKKDQFQLFVLIGIALLTIEFIINNKKGWFKNISRFKIRKKI